MLICLSLHSRVRVENYICHPYPFEATASMTCHSGPCCGDTLQAFISNSVREDTSEAWLPLNVSVSPGAVAGAGSVLVSLDLSFPDGAAYPLAVWFDNASFFAFGEGELPNEPPRVSREIGRA